MTNVEWGTWRNKLDIFVKGSTEGWRATEHLKQTSLQSKLDPFWYERITQAYRKEMNDITCDEIMEEISRTIRIRHPVCNSRAHLFRILKLEDRTAKRQYAHIPSMAKDADLDNLDDYDYLVAQLI